ncbi:MAG: GLUG motif-containing protein [Bacillota bacterium]|nr:GLUG motif-containing protein [Bacillota bacterium]
MTVNRPAASYQGFFGYPDSAEISNITLVNVSVHGYSYTDPLAGYAHSSSLENLHLTGEISSSRDYTGGLVGYLSGGNVHYCSFNGSVSGLGSYTGDLVGYAPGSPKIYHSYSLGTAAGNNKVGGLIGLLQDNSAALSDCYSRASVSGLQEVGGLTGYLWGKVYRSYSTGLVSAPEDAPGVGGLLGYKSGGSAVVVEGYYWDTQTSGQATSAGGSGKTTAEMKQQATFAGWNFTGDPAVWSIAEGADFPNLVQTTRSIALIPAVQFHGAGGVIGNIFQVISNTDWSAASNHDWLIVSGDATSTNSGKAVEVRPSVLRR